VPDPVPDDAAAELDLVVAIICRRQGKPVPREE